MMGRSNTLLKKIVLILLGLPTVLFIMAALTLALYTFIPVRLEVPEIKAENKLSLLFHGIHDTPESWSSELADVMNRHWKGHKAIAIDWSQYADSVFRCSVNGLQLGKKIGRQLHNKKEVEHLHLIGHSCGSFVIYGICKSLKQEKSSISIQTTYLDPVSNFGGFFTHYGVDYFGRCGDFSENYFDSGDKVPGSNEPLPEPANFDVTSARLNAEYLGNPHVWPVEYYMQLVRKRKNPQLWMNAHLTQEFTKGSLNKIR